MEDTSRGMVVVGISREDMLDIYEIRQRLEGIAAERAAVAISDDTLREMKETLGLQKFYIESEREPGENSDQIKNLDSRFHELLYQSCGSRPFTDTLISLHKKIIKYRKASITKHSRAVHALEEHTAIYTALAAGTMARPRQRPPCAMWPTPGPTSPELRRRGKTDMGKSLTQKLIEAHLVSGSTEPGAEVARESTRH